MPAPRFLSRASCGLAVLAALCGVAGARGAGFDPRAGLPRIQNFTPEVYHAHSQIFYTAQTADGTMYFATYGTVVSYDGERWRQYPVSGAWVRALVVGPDGLVYVGGVDSLGRLEPDPATGLLHFVSLAGSLPAAHREFGTVWSLTVAGGRVCAAIDGAILGWRDGQWRTWEFPKERPAVRLANGEAFAHIGTRVMHWQGDDWQPWIQDERLSVARRVVLVPGPAPKAYLVVTDAGDIYTARLDDPALTPWPTPIAAFLHKATIRNAVQAADGSYAISLAGEGVVFLAPDGTPLRRVTGVTGLAHEATYGLFSARDGTLWVETAGGVSRLDPAATWTVFDQRNGRPDATGGEPVRFGAGIALSISDTTPVWLRPAGDGLDHAKLEPFAGPLPNRLSNFVVVNGHLYAGGERKLMRLDPPAKAIHDDLAQIENILAVQACPGVVAIGMLHGIELVRIHEDDTVTPLGTVPDADFEITDVQEGADRTLWAGTTTGAMIRIRLNPEGTVRERTLFDESRGLPASSGWVQLLVSGGAVRAIVKGDVRRLAADGERFEPDPVFRDYHPAGINTEPFESDGQGRFWFQVARADGQYEPGCLDTRGPTPRWTSLDPGIAETLGFGGARMIRRVPEENGDFVWLSGARGTVRLSVDAPPPKTAPLVPVISEAVQGDKRWAPRANSPRLDFDREPLRFSFSCPDARGLPVRYEVRLLGYDASWNVVEGPEASFTNLSGGPFTLEVRARDTQGRTGEVARYTFSVAPPWHRTPLAYALYALGALGSVAGLMRWRLARAAREQARLEDLVNVRTAELATARDQAEAASRAKSAFLAAMSHELRTPLNGVIGYAQLLQADNQLSTAQRERLRIVHQSGEHLLRMINDVLDLAKIEAGKIELRPAPFALAELVHDICAAHAPTAAAKGLAFRAELAPDLPAWVEGDAQKLRQVLDNLLGNAVKFTATGSVTLRVSRDGERIALAVSDTGPGISAEDRERLFRPFEQARATRPAAPGTGLGLAIGRALVERMGGTLAVESTPGQGSTFSFAVRLPELAAPSAPAARAAVTGYDGPRRRVLIVDDHAVNRSLLGDLLRPLGFTCSEYPSGESALAALRDGTEPWPDLAIVDLRMDGLDGLALARQLRAMPRGRDLRVLLTSASVISFNAAEARAAGCDDFLPKPFRTSDVTDRVGALLGLTWRFATGATTPSGHPFAAAEPIGEEVRAALRDVLAQGDLDAFRAALARVRAAHPAAAARWEALDEAAAGYQLSRLRALLDLA